MPSRTRSPPPSDSGMSSRDSSATGGWRNSRAQLPAEEPVDGLRNAAAPGSNGNSSYRSNSAAAEPLEDRDQRSRSKKALPATREKPKWAVSGGSEDEQKMRQANSILNKLTLEKFEKLSDDFIKVGFTSAELLASAIDSIVMKAQVESHFSAMYAELCLKLSQTPLADLGEEVKGKKFKRLLLERCQHEFEKDQTALVQDLENLPDDERAERVMMLKRRYVGHMSFIGELFKVELLKDNIMHVCIQELFGDVEAPDEDQIECLIKLMSTVGKQMDASALDDKKNLKLMKAYFKQFKRLCTEPKLNSRIRFLIRDLLDLRDCNWKPRRATETAKTIAEIHDDIAREEGKGGKPKPKDKPKAGASEASGPVIVDGWETVAVTKKGKTKASAGGASAPGPGEWVDSVVLRCSRYAHASRWRLSPRAVLAGLAGHSVPS